MYYKCHIVISHIISQLPCIRQLIYLSPHLHLYQIIRSKSDSIHHVNNDPNDEHSLEDPNRVTQIMF